MTDPIIEEVREARAALAAEHGYDLQRIREWAKAAHEAREKATRADDGEAFALASGKREPCAH